MDTRHATAEDLPAVQRIWREVGWVDEDEAPALADFLADATTRVAVIDGEAEASGSTHRGTMRHGDRDVATSFVTSITTSRIGRGQGLARDVLDALLLDAAADGATLSMLGMFEQGYYDRSGFGTGAEMLMHRLDPASLPDDLPRRRPVRLSLDDAAEVDAALQARARGHGGVAIPSAAMRRAEMTFDDDGFGLGHRDARGALTHHVWCSVGGEHGPYRVRSWSWRTTEQLFELLGALRSLADQVRWLVLPEPWCLQLRTLTSLPGRQEVLTRGTRHHYAVDADAWWQARILDLPAAMAVLRSQVPLRLHVRVTDPLEETRGFDRVAGDWLLELDRDGSTATRPSGTADPDLVCSVNTLTRLWLGVRRPSTVLRTDGVALDDDLAAALDAAVRLPRPDVGHDF